MYSLDRIWICITFYQKGKRTSTTTEREANGKLGERSSNIGVSMVVCVCVCVFLRSDMGFVINVYLSVRLCGIHVSVHVMCSAPLCWYKTKAIRNLGVRHINFEFNEEILPKLTFRVRIFIRYSLVRDSAQVRRWAAKWIWFGTDTPDIRHTLYILNVSDVRHPQRWRWQRLINNWIRI